MGREVTADAQGPPQSQQSKHQNRPKHHLQYLYEGRVKRGVRLLMEQYRWTSPEIDHQMLRDGGMSVVQASLANVRPLGCVGGGVDANGGPQYLCSHHSQSPQGCATGVI